MFFFKQKTAYEMRIRDWSSDVCSSDLHVCDPLLLAGPRDAARPLERHENVTSRAADNRKSALPRLRACEGIMAWSAPVSCVRPPGGRRGAMRCIGQAGRRRGRAQETGPRSEEPTSELQSLMRTSYAVFCLKK